MTVGNQLQMQYCKNEMPKKKRVKTDITKLFLTKYEKLNFSLPAWLPVFPYARMPEFLNASMTIRCKLLQNIEFYETITWKVYETDDEMMARSNP